MIEYLLQSGVLGRARPDHHRQYRAVRRQRGGDCTGGALAAARTSRSRPSSGASVAAIVMRVILTIVAVELLTLPYLKLVGGLLLFWIAVQLLVPEDDGEDGIESSGNLLGGDPHHPDRRPRDEPGQRDRRRGRRQRRQHLLMLGLAISIPLIIFGSTIILKLMDRFPIIITGGAALLGWVAGEMLITDPILVSWIATNMPWMHIHLPVIGEISWAQILGAALGHTRGQDHGDARGAHASRRSGRRRATNEVELGS